MFNKQKLLFNAIKHYFLHSREQLKAELERQWEEREIGAFLPAIPDIDILIQNKCRYVNVSFNRKYSI